MKTDNVVIKKSSIHGSGVFAGRDFKTGEIVLRWDKSNVLSSEDAAKMTEEEKRYISLVDGKYIIMQEPEKFVNHSCDSNTTAKQFSDIATRDIKEGEEITSNYNGESPTSVKFKCDCGSSRCSDSGKC